MDNITIWVVAGLAIGALTASILHSHRFPVYLIGAAVICSIGGLLATTQTHFDASTFIIALLSLIAGGIATHRLLTSPTQEFD